MIKDIKMRLVALIEENYNSTNDKDFKVINFLPDIKVKKVIEQGVHKCENGIYYFEVDREKDTFQIPYTINIKDLSVLIGTNGSGKTTIINKIYRGDNRENKVHLIFERDGSLYTYPKFKQDSISLKQSDIHPFIIKFSNAKEFSNKVESMRSGAIDASNFKYILPFNKNDLKSSNEKNISLEETINQIKFIEEFKDKINQFADYTKKGITVNFQSDKLIFNSKQLIYLDDVSQMKKNDVEKENINLRLVDYFSVLINHIIDTYYIGIEKQNYEQLLKFHISLWDDIFKKQSYEELPEPLYQMLKNRYRIIKKDDIRILYALFILNLYFHYLNENIGKRDEYRVFINDIIKENISLSDNTVYKGSVNQRLMKQFSKGSEIIKLFGNNIHSLENISSIILNMKKEISDWQKIWEKERSRCIKVVEALGYTTYFKINKDDGFTKYKLVEEKVWKDLISIGISEEEIVRLKDFKSLLLYLEDNTTDFEYIFSIVNCLSEIKISEVSQSIQMSWVGLSSGELGLLKSFANLYLAKKVIEKSSGRGIQKKNVLLLLDEVDLGLHPEWQRKWISTALPIIEKIFDDKYLQIIITTHSPIFLSDIYEENIIFLATENNEESIEKTFGQNVYTLFKNSFFLNDVMGEYAFNTIKDTIEFLSFKVNSNSSYNREESLYNNSDEIINEKIAKKVIDSVGEPIIANQLKELFYKAFPNKNDEISEIQNKINQLQIKLRQLEEEHSQ